MRILIVEDEQKVATSVGKALTAAGYLPEITDDGENAWFLGETEDYSAIILDVGLPRLDGLSILKRWRKCMVCQRPLPPPPRLSRCNGNCMNLSSKCRHCSRVRLCQTLTCIEKRKRSCSITSFRW